MAPYPDEPTAPPSGGSAPDRSAHRIDRAVERELTRRRRLILFFGALLLVPIVMGFIAVHNGRSDVGRLATVEASLDSVKPSIAKIRGLDTTLTQVAAVTSRVKANSNAVVQLQRDQASLHDSLARSTTALRDSQRTLVARTEALQMQLLPTQDSLRAVRAQVAQFQTLVSEQDVHIKRLEAVQTRIQTRQDDQDARIRASQATVQRLQVQTDSLVKLNPKTIYQRPH